MSSFDLDTIRHAISSRMQQGRLALSNPSAIVAALATTALFSLLPEGTLSQPLLDSILINIIGGGLGVSALYDFLRDFIDNLQPEEESQYSADEIRQRFEQALLERLEESGQDARVLRADVSRLLRHVEGINVALSAAPTDLRQPLVDGLIELGSNFEEFRWILIEQSQLLVLIRQRSQDIMSDVQRLVRQVARLEQNQQALPAKLKLLLLFQSERSATPPPPPAAGTSPYKGLPAFQKEDADYFFGREEQVADLVHQLAQDKRFLAVIGPSGSGKSSLVRAGLLSQLDSNTAHQLLHSRDWRTVIFKPGDHPIAALANHVGSLSINIGSRALLRGLQDSPDELARAIRQQLLHNEPLHVRLLLIVDQFEELFTRCRDESERLRFIESLLHVSQTTACRTIVLLTMRADFYGHCASHPRLRSQIQDHHLLVGPLHENELRRVIELPANKAGLQLDPGLTETIIKDVADAPGALPLLSQALLETWKRRQDNTLTREGYEASGGVQQAIAQTADKVYNEQLTSEQQAIARQIFLRLVELGESEQYDSRRRTSRSELLTTDRPEHAALIEEVLVKLADARLIVTDQPSLSPSQQWEGSVEVAHEALIREWPSLRHWLDEDREGLRIHRHLTEAAQEWESLGRDIGDLYRGARLAQAREWAEQHPNNLNALEQEFLQASQQAVEEARQRELEQARALAEEQRKRAEAERERADTERSTRQRVGRFAMGLVVLFLLAVGIAFYANIKAEEALEAEAAAEVARDEADQKAEEALDAQAAAEVARSDAEEQARIAQAQANGAQALFELTNNPDRALLLALAAIRLDVESPQPVVLRALRNTVETTLIRQVFAGHTDDITSVAFSPTGELVATGSNDQTARLWDAWTGKVFHTLQGHTKSVTSVAFSPTGELVATGCGDHLARLWDVQTGELKHTLQGHTSDVTSVAFSPTGEQVLTRSPDDTVRLWDVQTGTEIHTLQGHTDSVTSVAFSPSGAFILTGSEDNTARLWDAQTGKELHTLQGHILGVRSVAFSPTGEQVLTSGGDVTTRLWDAQTGKELHTLQGHTLEALEVLSVAFSPTGEQVLTGNYDGTARLWDAQTGKELHTMQGHTSSIMSVAFSPTGEQVLTGSRDHTARLFSAQTGKELHTLQGHTDEVSSVAFSPTGEQVLTRSRDNTARLWDVQTGTEIHTLQGHTDWVESVAFSPTGAFILTGSRDSTARLWDVQTGTEIHTLQGHIGRVESVAFSPTGEQVLTYSSNWARLWDAQTGTELRQDHFVSSAAFSPTGEQLLTNGDDSTARLWDVQTGQLKHTLQEHTSYVTSVAFSPTGEQVLTGSRDHTARLFSAQTGKELHTLQGHTDTVWSVAFSPTGEQVLTRSTDGTARLFSAQTGKELHTLQGHTDRVVFSPTGEQVLTSSTDGTVHLFSAQTGKELHTLEGHTDDVMSVAFSSTGEQVLTGSHDGTARLWDVQTGKELHTLEGHIDGVMSVAFSSTGELVATSSEDQTARLFSAQTGKELHILQGHTDDITSVAFNPTGELVATGSQDRTVRLWIADDNLLIAKLTSLVCGVWGHREEAISAEIPDWRGCEVELEAVKGDLAKYNDLRPEE